ncbi:zinc transporter ZIP13-like [Ornithodoros turicata]|uniref:zinc transporter ZIP13-like n=1 Tax=Ornithodoros turicata TaxID=34597 RepID=UPI003138DE1E
MSTCTKVLTLVITSLDSVVGDRNPASMNGTFEETTHAHLGRAWQFLGFMFPGLSVSRTSCDTWILSIIAACLVGLSGVLPLLIVPVETGASLKHNISGRMLKLLLSFAVGGLLGDVFLHLLPEAWARLQDGSVVSLHAYFTLGLWVLLGVFTFVILELVFTAKPPPHCKASTVNVTGYLNLAANCIDNFTHGLAVAASFLVGNKMGLVTTFAILVHEIPHEVGDFAILLKAGFSRWDAAKAQLWTAMMGIAGAVTALSANSLEDVDKSTSWILPFTCGGFLNIALVSVLPDLLEEDDPWESAKQLACVCCGISIMGVLQVALE